MALISLGVGLGSSPPLSSSDWLVALSLLAVLVVVERLDVSIPINVGTLRVSAGAPIALAGAMHFSVGVGCLIVLTGHVIDSLLAKRDPIKSITNISTFVGATAIGGFVYHALADLSLSPVGSAANLGASLVASAAFVTVNTVVLATIIAPIVGMPLHTLWQSTLRLSAIESVTFPAVGGLVALAADANAAAVILLAFPLVGPQVAYRTLMRAQRSVRDTLESLADAVEQRDPYTYNHSVRVTATAKRILDEMPDVPYELTDTIVQAARVHDIGKVGTRDLTLYKPGPLTIDERLEMQRHSEVGSAIVARTHEYRLTAEIIRHHHEAWNGTGYPDKLTEHDIPLGARVIAVADAYDAMTSDRPYRKGMGHAVAMAEIVRNSGIQFDPSVVSAFERAMGEPESSLQPSLSRDVALAS